MRKWLRSPLIIGVIVVFVLFLASFVGGYWFQWGWTGFPVKTLWDWLQLLGVFAVPVAVGLGAAWYTAKQTQAGEATAERQRKNELDIATDNQREAALQAYIDKMSELLIEKNLRNSVEKDEIRYIARIRTLTVLRRLNEERKGSVIEFLQEADLIDKSNPIVILTDADISHAYLSLINLKNTKLSGTKLSDTNLMGADLTDTDLSDADLSHTILRNAQLNDANLIHAHFSGANLSRANLSKSHLSHAYLGYADLNHAILSGADLSYTNLTSTNFSYTNLISADLSYAEFSDTNFSGANLSGANLSNTSLDEADFSHADLSGAIVTQGQLKKAKSLKGATMPDGSKHL